MNRRRFFASPLAALGFGMPAATVVVAPVLRERSVSVNIAPQNVHDLDQRWVDKELMPMLRAAINDHDVVIINESSRQARELSRS